MKKLRQRQTRKKVNSTASTYSLVEDGMLCIILRGWGKKVYEKPKLVKVTYQVESLVSMCGYITRDSRSRLDNVNFDILG